MERMMKLQDVLLKAMAKKITWWEAAEIIGISDRTMRRWRERSEEHGYSGLADRRRNKPSEKRVPLAMAEEVLRLYHREKPVRGLRTRFVHLDRCDFERWGDVLSAGQSGRQDNH